MSFDFMVPPPIEAVDQGNGNLCWLAATSVLFGWRDSSPLSLADSAARLGVEFTGLFGASKALPAAWVPLWAERGGYSKEGLQCIDASGWDSLLRQHGPLIVLVDGTGGGVINHAVVVYGIVGDGSPDGTTLQVANGQGGAMEKWTFFNFVTIFEAEAGANLSFSVLYFSAPRPLTSDDSIKRRL